MKVLIVGANYAPEPSGSAPYTAGLARELALRGHEVDVVTTRPHYPQWQVYEGFRRGGNEVDHGVLVRRLRSYVPREPKAIHRLAFEVSFGLGAALRRLPAADAIVLASPAMFSTALLSARLRLGRHTPRVVWVQDLYGAGVEESGMTDSRYGLAVNALESWVLRGADRVVTIHPNMKQRVVSTLGVPEQRTEIVRNWTHLAPMAPIERDHVRRQMGWSAEEIIVLHSGNMGFKQGLEVVVDAARVAAERELPIKFVLMGDGNQRRMLQERSSGLTNTIEFLPPLPDGEYQAAMGACDVLLLVDRAGVGSMSVPSKLTSYFTTGVPVLGSTDPKGNAGVEILDSGGGILSVPGDPDHLVDQVLWLAEHPEQAQEMGRRGQEFCARVLDKVYAVDQFEALLTEVAQGSRSTEAT